MADFLLKLQESDVAGAILCHKVVEVNTVKTLNDGYKQEESK